MPWKSITAMLCVTTLVSIALFRGIDGLSLALGIGAVLGIGGWAIGRVHKP